MRDERDEPGHSAPPSERLNDNLRIFPLSRIDKRPVLRRLTSEELARINELVAEYELA